MLRRIIFLNTFNQPCFVLDRMLGKMTLNCSLPLRPNLWRLWLRRICKRQGRLQLVGARVEEEGVTRRRVERERALRLAYVVAAHGLFAELKNEFRTVVDFERLALRLRIEKWKSY